MKKVLFYCIIMSFFCSCLKDDIGQHTMNYVEETKEPALITKRSFTDSDVLELAETFKNKNLTAQERTNMLQTYFSLDEDELSLFYDFLRALNKQEYIINGYSQDTVEVVFEYLDSIVDILEEKALDDFSSSLYRLNNFQLDSILEAVSFLDNLACYSLFGVRFIDINFLNNLRDRINAWTELTFGGCLLTTNCPVRQGGNTFCFVPEEPAYHIDLYDLNCIKNTQDDIVCDNNFIYLLINTPSAEACNWDSPDGEVLAAMLANGYNGNVDSYVGAATHRAELVIGHTVTKNLILSGHVFSPISHLKANLKIVDLECRTCF